MPQRSGLLTAIDLNFLAGPASRYERASSASGPLRLRSRKVILTMNDHANPTFEKRQAYEAATSLMAKHDADSLRYAALELRRCIEAIVYEKLKVYGDLLPEGSARKWQPGQAFDALIAVEPKAEEDLTWAVALQPDINKMPEGPLQRIGVDQRPTGKWIKKTWQKLGSYLHAEWPFAASHNNDRMRTFLVQVHGKIAPFVRNSFSAMMTMIITFQCQGCGAAVKAMENAVEKDRTAACLACGLRYRAEKEEDSFKFFPDEPPFQCECGAVSFFPSRSFDVGHRFSCGSCRREFHIVGLDWKYQVVIPQGTSAPTEP